MFFVGFKLAIKVAEIEAGWFPRTQSVVEHSCAQLQLQSESELRFPFGINHCASWKDSHSFLSHFPYLSMEQICLHSYTYGIMKLPHILIASYLVELAPDSKALFLTSSSVSDVNIFPSQSMANDYSCVWNRLV